MLVRQDAEASSPSSTVDTERITVDFWFDPACPWAWITSRWALELEKVRPVDLRWRVMSLALLNEGREGMSPEMEAGMASLWGPVRIIVAARRAHGDAAVLQLYTAFGERFHRGTGERAALERATYLEVLESAGLPASLADAADDASLDDEVRAEHTAGLDLVGTDVGTPIIAWEGGAFFGPIVTPVPRGEAAGRLWDGIRLLNSVDGFFELKRSRDRSPDVLS